jgi:hypothetical protein
LIIASTVIYHIIFKKATLLDYQGLFALHEQEKNPCPPEIFLIISHTENSTFLST